MRNEIRGVRGEMCVVRMVRRIRWIFIFTAVGANGPYYREIRRLCSRYG